MYSLFIYIYEFGVFVASLFSDKVKRMRIGEKEAFSILRQKVQQDAEYAWFHAASLGEFEQGRPIMEEYRRLYPERKILLTFFSPSGYEVRKDYEGADIVCYLPLDTPAYAKRFLNLVMPVEAFFIKYEFWYNYLRLLHERQVPVYSVSSIFRKEQIFFRWYGWWYAGVLKCITHFFVQNQVSADLLQSAGIECVTVTGDTRFDRVRQIAKQSKTIDEVSWFKDGRKVFIAGSSWQPDEEIFIPYFAEHKDWKMVIAPHVIGENHLVQIEELLKGRKVLRFTQISKLVQESETNGNDTLSSVAEKVKEAEVLIIDCFGLLSSIYKYGDVAYVGGGFGVGIHNLPEAAVWSKPVIFGPNHQRFQEALELKACGGGIAINGAEDFKEVMDGFILDEERLADAARKAGEYVATHSGATDIILKALAEK